MSEKIGIYPSITSNTNRAVGGGEEISGHLLNLLNLYHIYRSLALLFCFPVKSNHFESKDESNKSRRILYDGESPGCASVGGGGGGLTLEGGLAAREGLNRARMNSSTQVSLHIDDVRVR